MRHPDFFDKPVALARDAEREETTNLPATNRDSACAAAFLRWFFIRLPVARAPGFSGTEHSMLSGILTSP